jgi:hypothetical protein
MEDGIMKKIGLVLTIALIFSFAAGLQPVRGETINIIPYYVTGGEGASWTYEYDTNYSSPTPSAFTVTQTQVTSGIYAGLSQIGNYVNPDNSINWRIFDADANSISLYANQNGAFSPSPTVVNGTVTLDEFVTSPFPNNEEMVVYFTTTTEELSTPAGTFNDLLVYVVFDTNYPNNNNESNTALEENLNMAPSEYNVTHLSVLACGIGEVLNIDFDAATGNILSEYMLTNTNLSQCPGTPLPSTLLCLVSGLLGLAGWRRFRKS